VFSYNLQRLNPLRYLCCVGCILRSSHAFSLSFLLFGLLFAFALNFSGWSALCAGKRAPRLNDVEIEGSVVEKADSLPCSSLRFNYTGVNLGKGELTEPLGIVSDTRGFIYVADGMVGRVYRYSIENGSVEFEGPTNSPSIYPIDIACVGSFVYVLDYAGRRVLRYDYRGAYLDVLVSFDDSESDHPVSLTAAFDGRFITTDSFNHRVTVWSPLMDMRMDIGGFEWGGEGLMEPSKALMLRDNRVVVLDSKSLELKYFSASGALDRTVELDESLGFSSPRYICSDMDDRIFIADPEAGILFVVSDDGKICRAVDSCGGKAIEPSAATVGWNGELFVADLSSRSILVFRISYPDR